MNGAEPADGTEEIEEELRVLLHRAVPVLAEPEDRMERVLERADRARRRRRATALGLGLTGGLVAAALAAAPALAPAPDHGAVGPAAPGPARTSPSPGAVTPRPSTATPSVPPSVSPAVSPPATGEFVRFLQIGGLAVTVPPGWYSDVAAFRDGNRLLGYLANQPFDVTAPCTQVMGVCTPIGPLAPDRAYLILRLVDVPDQAKAAAGGTTGPVDVALDKECFGHGGNRETVSSRNVDGPQVTVRIELTACAREPSEATLRQVRQVLDSLRFAG
ncbi:hypothetical protein ABT247_19225 [Kitasatospora sp. NPDC001539]|uniref:hypothetical protein n=1 Tax=Kitasatospora sp. NPDC001539 TaxID=3154384 RepID=UPI00333462E6